MVKIYDFTTIKKTDKDLHNMIRKIDGLEKGELQPDGLTLDQLTIFVTVVDTGSFSAAARKLRRAQSVITYGMQNLELQVGRALFDRSTYRASLTIEGVALLPRARRVLEGATGFRRQARSIIAGIEPRLRIALDVMASKRQLIAALKDFSRAFPAVEIVGNALPLEETLAALRTGEADLGIIVESQAFGSLEEMERRPYGRLRLIPVAAPDHPLAQAPGPIGQDSLYDHTQILLSAGRQASGTTDLSAHATNRWRLNDLALRREFLLAGLGWGRMPDEFVEDDLTSGRLVALPLDPADAALHQIELPISVANMKTKVLGPAARWLADRLASQSGAVENGNGSSSSTN